MHLSKEGRRYRDVSLTRSLQLGPTYGCRKKRTWSVQVHKSVEEQWSQWTAGELWGVECETRQRQRPHQRGGRHAKWRNSEWATANGKRGAAMQRRWRLPKGVLRPRFAIKKRRFPLRPCSGIDSAVGRPWQHADVNEEKALTAYCRGGRRGPGMAWRTAIRPRRTRPIAPTIGRLCLRRAGRPFGSSLRPCAECSFRDFAALGHSLGRSGVRRAAAPAEFISRSAVSKLKAKRGPR